MMNLKRTAQSCLAAALLTTLLLIGSASAAPASADAHALQAWQCLGLSYKRAPNGKRFAWTQRCMNYRRDHAKAHRYGPLWQCYELSGTPHVKCVVRRVFAPVGQSEQAVRVVRCESTYRTTARNGQYRGIFQMGSSERARFGHGVTAEAQARAALRYYRLAGWRPWECKPW